jgi:hypothetical protein
MKSLFISDNSLKSLVWKGKLKEGRWSSLYFDDWTESRPKGKGKQLKNWMIIDFLLHSTLMSFYPKNSHIIHDMMKNEIPFVINGPSFNTKIIDILNERKIQVKN